MDVERRAPPEPERLFSCPIEVVQEDFTPAAHWSRLDLPSWGISLGLPPGWTLKRAPGRFDAGSADRSLSVSVRLGKRQAPQELQRVRAELEATELGPPFLRQSCMEGVENALRNEAPWTRLRFMTYGRPLGERRRRVALYVPLEQGVLSVIVATRWSRGDRGPDWSTIWSLLGGLRMSDTHGDPSLARALPDPWPSEG